MIDNENSQAKEDLLENISELFLKYGLRSTSMDDICAHLKISKKTLYQFFTNKDDVVEQVMLHRRENHQVQKNLEELKQHNVIEIMWIIKEHIIHDMNSQMPANLFDLKKYHPDVYERINESHSKFFTSLLHELLDKGEKQGFLLKDIQKEIQIYLFIKQMSFLNEPEMISDTPYPADIIVSTIVENMIRSLATPKGIEELDRLINNQEK
ncbi:MAG: TetR/AcrR family transcriptional regulator [Odoribacter sp.]